MREDEAADHAERVEHATATRDFQKHQASLKQRKEKERLALLQKAAMLEDMQDGADAQFRTYGQGCIDSYAQQGPHGEFKAQLRNFELTMTGSATECRLLAEDPCHGLLPTWCVLAAGGHTTACAANPKAATPNSTTLHTQHLHPQPFQWRAGRGGVVAA